MNVTVEPRQVRMVTIEMTEDEASALWVWLNYEQRHDPRPPSGKTHWGQKPPVLWELHKALEVH